MSKSLSNKSDKILSSRAVKLQTLLSQDADAMGQLYDARICNDIAIQLYKLRKDSGLTQKDLAYKLQIKQSNVSRWEKPGYQGYKVKMLSKLSRALGGRLYIGIYPHNSYTYFMQSFKYETFSRVIETSASGNSTTKEVGFKFNMKTQGVVVNAKAF
jgi:transcriptional regulator with XRE-family HTH domain